MLISWQKRNQCELINTSDISTFIRNIVNRKYTSTLDLTFSTSQLSAEIIDWQIKENEYSDSDYEVIQYSIITEDITLIKSSFNSSFNIQKAKWTEFKQQLYQESKSMLEELKHLERQELNQEQMKEIACNLRNLITKAAEQNISRRKSCSRSKCHGWQEHRHWYNAMKTWYFRQALNW